MSALEPRLLLAATMVKDINTDSISSNPARFVALNGKTLFRADDGVHGNEWFVTNGSAQGTGLLLDVNPGHAGSAPLGAAPAFTPLPDDVATSAVMNGTMFFAGNDGTSGTELWTTDGTPAGTVRLKDIRPGPEGSSPRHLMVVGNSVYFVADDGTNGFELWRTDGTEDGTRMVADLTPPGDSFQPVPLGAVGDRLVFAAAAADIAGPGLEPWVTDGTPGGTLLLKDLRPSGGSDPGIVQAAAANLFRGDAAAVGDTLYFAANDAVHGRELWKTDGTSEGTVLVADKTAGTRSTSPLSLTVAGSSVYFRAFTGSLGTRVTYFKTDPTSGVVSVGELGDESGMKMGALGGEFLLVVPIGGALRLYKHDPASPAGTQLSLVKALPDARGSSWGNEVIEWNGAAYFLARGNDGPRATMDLWRSDGTDAGTVRVARFDAPPTGVTPRLAAGGDDNLYFAATEVADGTEPYISDGTDAGTRRLVDLAPSSSDGVTGGVAAVETPTGTRGLFVATEREHGSELWVTDGTAAGTNLLKDINPGPASGVPANNFVFNGKMDNFSPPFNGRVYFQAEASGVGPELWASDGTEAGTYLVKDIVPGFNGSSPGGFTPFHGRMYFTLGTSAGVWVTDGTAEGTGMSDVPVSSAAGFHRLVVAGDWMYFALDRIGGASELWKTDGTAAGTSLVSVVAPGPDAQVFADGFRTVWAGGVLYFTTRRTINDGALWRTDGTDAGTKKITDLPSLVSDMVEVGGRLLIDLGRVGTAVPPQVWVSDGTSEGTAPLASLAPALADVTNLPGLSTAGGAVVFFGNAADGSFELWRTDGTAAGTRKIRSIARAGAVTGSPLNSGRGITYFRVVDATGPELWQTDGTDGGTVMVQDLRPGPADVPGPALNPDNLTFVGDRAFFTADDGAHGSELWSMPAPLLVAAVVGRHLFYNHSAFDGNDAAANAGDDGAVAAGKAALLPGQVASFSNVTGYTRGINGVMIDVAGGLPLTALAGIAAGVGLKVGTGGDPAAWGDAPRPAQVGIRPGAGVGGSDRITLVWPDGAIRNTWLRVTVRAAPASGLAADDVFTFGNLVGESGDAAGPLVVGAADALGTRRAASVGAVGIGNPYDHNRDGVVNVLDYAAALRNVRKSLVPLPPPVAAQASVPPRLRSIPPRRSILTDAQAPVRTE